MFNFSLSVCRHVVCRRSFRLMCGRLTQNKIGLQSIKFDTLSDQFEESPKVVADHTRSGLSFTTKYLNEMENPEEIKWDWLTEKMEELKLNNIPTKILQACIRLHRLDFGLKYYNYLVEKDVKLSSLDLMFFCKLLAMKKNEIKNHEQLLIHLYNNIKEFLQSSILIRQLLMEAFVEIPYCFKDIVENRRHVIGKGGYAPVVEKALQLNMPDVAFDFMNDSDFFATASFVETYVNFCIKRAEEGKFSKDFINKLINLCTKKALPLGHENLLEPLSALVSVLNKHDNYEWSVHECELNKKQECSKCGSTLLPNNITDEEFRQLKDCFFKQSFIESNVFLSSTRDELKKFIKFLKTTDPYNLVLDGLNLLYKNKRYGGQVNNRDLKYFLDKGYRILTIGRKHSKKILTGGEFLKNDDYKSRAQFFFTLNMSDDDVFLLYATLYGGPGTFFVTGDYLGKYLSRLDDKMKCTFLKWQLSHQYLINPNMDLSPPLPHCGLPQLTVKTKKKCIWHLSQQTVRLNVGNPVNWYCLKAEKKFQKQEEKKNV